MKEKRILVIGGAGYIGSHFTYYATGAGCHVTVVDNLSKGHLSALRGNAFFRADLNDPAVILEHLSDNHYDGIFHFAASCLVGESMSDPAHYYQNNILAPFNMLEAMRATRHDKIVFSSSCAVYGAPRTLPLKEGHPKDPISPYGRTKLAIEWMLEDYGRAYGIRSASLRYFNAAGCEPSEGLGEDHRPETHLIPNAVRYALKLDDRFAIFGNDYPTPDGTCVRDYIHVMDLAEAHLIALEKLAEASLIRLNLGTGSGFSNLEIVQAVSRVAKMELRPEIGPRRPGDPPELVADASESFDFLGWRPVRSQLDAIISEVWKWISDNPAGYPE
ncbi:MAG: UDP-glucose 4-epimerase GalE [Desulfomonile tiedjei]|uniref:UDP-glucose 4-epimerase n=1 Tax=Desulfomonile tiedjei TaxID=2358 RepID=A0A9D6V0L0_9BACT|nr:UDP-glucose 4-epimerase GalE [Desulfomonile tiedjei]